jgi:hypothetical protein
MPPALTPSELAIAFPLVDLPFALLALLTCKTTEFHDHIASKESIHHTFTREGAQQCRVERFSHGC